MATLFLRSLEPDAATGYRTFFLSNDGTVKHEKPRHALQAIMCPSLECGLPDWKCVLWRCEGCPSYIHHPLECTEGPDLPTITFHHYCNATKCTKHGNLTLNAKTCGTCEELPEGRKKGKTCTCKHLTLLTRPIRVFLEDYYLPKLKDYAYHSPHVRILSKKGVGNERLESFKSNPWSVYTHRDNAE